MNRNKVLLLLFWLTVLISPFVFGFLSNNKDQVFNGFLLNPIDGNTYLAKMQQGYAGEWFYQLPYTSASNGKVLLFIFYLLLGHAAKLFHLPVLWVFHTARILSSVFMFFVIIKFVKLMPIKLAYLKFFIVFILLFGGGLGWLYLISGDLPVDFWVAEAFPFLSALSNPHFPLSIALILLALIFALTPVKHWWHKASFGLIGFVLANISPFSVVIILIILLSQVIIHREEGAKEEIIDFAIAAAFSLPVVLYQFLSIKNDLLLSGWNAQNITPAPTILNFLFSFSPFLIGLVWMYFLIRIRGPFRLTSLETTLAIWIFSTIILLYLPLNLQRRFMVGFYIPVAALFFLFLNRYFQIDQFTNERIKIRIVLLITLLGLPSSLFVLTGSINAIKTRNENLFLPTYLEKPATWMSNSVEPESVVLSGPHTGLLLPSLAPVKTVYGHPFETVNANQTLLQVTDFWTQEPFETSRDLIKIWEVDYLFYGLEEQTLSNLRILDRFHLVYADEYVKIFKVSDD